MSEVALVNWANHDIGLALVKGLAERFESRYIVYFWLLDPKNEGVVPFKVKVG